MFGPYLTDPELEFHRVYATDNRPSRVYFNEWDPDQGPPWVTHLGLEKTETDTLVRSERNRQGRYPPSLIPSAPPPYTLYNEVWFYTNCRMENIKEIVYCVDETVTDKPVTGMMLHYTNGRRSCLGQYRPDLALVSLRTDATKKLRIGVGKTSKRFPFVAEVTVLVHGAAELRSSTWVDVPWHGRLEWWFTLRQCKLRHFG